MNIWPGVKGQTPVEPDTIGTESILRMNKHNQIVQLVKTPLVHRIVFLWADAL